MATNLWKDVDALARLARSEHAAERASTGARDLHLDLPSGVFPPFPESNEFAIHAINTPAQVVTGDYFDFFQVNEDTLAIVMADVSGKGIPAALMTGVTRSVVRNVAADSPSPSATLTRANKFLYDAGLDAMYVTIFLGWYDIRTGSLRYANAGHPRPFSVSPDASVRVFGEVTGPILGILDAQVYREGEEPLAVGERLVLYTDGVTEAISASGEFFGPGRLQELLTRHAAAPVDQLCAAVSDEVNTFQAGHRQDDATVLALQRKT